MDCGAVADGWNGDTARTVHVGNPTPQDIRQRHATEDALAAGTGAARPGATLLDVAAAIDAVARAAGSAPLPDHGGHSIGRSMHEPPFVPNRPTREAQRHRLPPGNTIAIEPVLHAGTSRYRGVQQRARQAAIGRSGARFNRACAARRVLPDAQLATSGPVSNVPVDDTQVGMPQSPCVH